MSETKKKLGQYGLGGLGLLILVAVFFVLGPPQLLAKSESPLFCAGCHVMEAEFDAWAHTGAHRREKCVECHLPNRNTGLHYVWKSIDGMKDTLMFYSGRVPERIVITDHGRAVVQSNCIRCHETTVDHINQERLCWDCHRRIAHRKSGSIQTI
ncbi:MAG: cytochrome c nitrite reductase small subunit [Deltaproteobacteria bacterium RIFOXYD12_FULL_50_9]|nr:MAG: cytochrome c nitrite reductase small subunit [Deltaproteobacteria bacterium RIFOXYD12_FULL_50_9]